MFSNRVQAWFGAVGKGLGKAAAEKAAIFLYTNPVATFVYYSPRLSEFVW